MKTTLQNQIEEINTTYNDRQKELEASRQKMIELVWKQNIDSGLLKSELS